MKWSYKLCKHEKTGEGPRTPALYGSWETRVCIDCGHWRIFGEKEWKDPKELLIAIARHSLGLDGQH